MLRALGVGRDDGEDGRGLTDAVALVVDEEEGVVLPEGTAEGAAELILAILALLDRVEVVAGVEEVVAEELKGRAVEGVGAGLGGDEDGGASAGAVLGGVVEGEDVELLDGVDLGEEGHAAAGELVIVDAIEAPVVGVFGHALYRQGDRPAERDFGAGALVEEVGGLLAAGGAGGEQGELGEVASVEGEIGDLLGVDGLAEGGIGAGDDGFGLAGADVDRGGDACGLQGEVEAEVLLAFEGDVFLIERSEAGVDDVNDVGADGEKGEGKGSGGAGLRLAGLVGLLAGDDDGGAGEGGAGGIEDAAGDGAGGLGMGSGGRQGEQEGRGEGEIGLHGSSFPGMSGDRCRSGEERGLTPNYCYIHATSTRFPPSRRAAGRVFPRPAGLRSPRRHGASRPGAKLTTETSWRRWPRPFHNLSCPSTRVAPDLAF